VHGVGEPLISALGTAVTPKVIAYPPNEALQLSELASLVVRQLPPGKVVLLAESFSGLVALTLLASASARIRGVIFVGAFAEPPRPFLLRLTPMLSRASGLARSTPSFLLRQFCLGSDASATQLQSLRDAIGLVSPEVLAQRLTLVASRHRFDNVPADVPSYYIQASGDRLVPASCVQWFQHRFRKCEIEKLDGPHFLLQARPRESAQMIAMLVGQMTSPRP
jgi:pimeloyl-[acyl-carrier protein] methyl ester esterase